MADSVRRRLGNSTKLGLQHKDGAGFIEISPNPRGSSIEVLLAEPSEPGTAKVVMLNIIQDSVVVTSRLIQRRGQESVILSEEDPGPVRRGDTALFSELVRKASQFEETERS